MVAARTDLKPVVEKYISELERLGVPVERVILYGSHSRGVAHADSDIDLAIFSPVFGPPNLLEFSGLLSEAKWNSEPMIEAIGFHPAVLQDVKPISFLHEVVTTGTVIYRSEA